MSDEQCNNMNDDESHGQLSTAGPQREGSGERCAMLNDECHGELSIAGPQWGDNGEQCDIINESHGGLSIERMKIGDVTGFIW